MQWIAKILGLFLAICLALTAQAWILNQTIWNPTYVSSKINETKIADQLAVVLPDIAVQITGEQEQTRLAIKEAFTPRYIQSQLDTLVPQTINYIRGNGPQPTLDIRDIEAKITNAGLPIPPQLQSYISTPTPVSAGPLDGVVKGVSTRGTQILWLGPIFCLVLIGAIFILGRTRRWSTLSGSFVLTAVLLGIFGAISLSPSYLIGSTLDTSAGKLLTPVVKPLLQSISQDQAHALWITAGISLGIALIFAVIHMVVKTFRKHHKKPKAPEIT